jgi:gliding motility-associated-like protein
MKKTLLALCLLFLATTAFSLNFTIIESQSMNVGHNMDVNWQTIVTGMGHTATIAPQTTLDNNAFFATTDILIVSSGVIDLFPNRVATILQFLQTGKSVYLQSEYLDTYTTNQAFASLVASLGGTFAWTAPFSGDLNPMNVLGTYATTNNAIASLPYFWYSYAGSGDCNTVNILQYGGAYHGFQYIPVNPSNGTIMTTADQDWVRDFSASAQLLMQNLVTHMINPPTGTAGVQVDLGSDTTLCNSNALLLDATTPGASYQWQDGSTNANYNVNTAGTYWVVVNVGGCIGVDTIHISYFPPQMVDLGNDTSICQGASLLLDATTSGGSYLWQNSSTNPTFSASSAGSYWVEVTVSGCSGRDTINVGINPLPVVDLGDDTTLCIGSTLSLDATTSGGSYLWQNSSTGATFNATSTGIYWVDVTVAGCTARDSILVNFTPSPTVYLGPDTTLCVGNTLLLNATTAGATYLWQNSSNAATFNVNAAGTYWVEVNVSGCIDRDTIVVNYVPIPVVDLGDDTAFCQGNTLLLNATTPGANYNWQNGSSNATFSVSTSGMYWVQVSVGTCVAGDTINVVVNPIPSVDLGNDSILCQGNTVLLDATTAGATYLWQNASTNPTFNANSNGTYWVVVTANSCSAGDSIVLTFNPVPSVSLGADTTICDGDVILLSVANPGGTYLWQDASTSSAFTVSQPGIYSVTVSVGGCSNSDAMIVGSGDCSIVLYIPNVFTPNGDGENDILYARGLGVQEFEFYIYDRWGERVFRTTDLNEGWDGTFRGKECDKGVFVYFVKVKYIDGNEEKRKGNITLLR